MSEKHTFRAVIENAGGGGAFVRIPFDVEEIFGKKRVKVKATINGEPYRGTLVRMGEPCHILIVLKEIREKIGKTFGDQVEVTVEEDTEPYVVEIPPELAQALKQEPEVEAVFLRMAYSHQREYVRWISEAKRAETRQKRVAEAIEILKRGGKLR
jgi:bifunctional DNA-binding transcriptional regulator/antitoxin component of YhaV-PrlF toxin-antitoxin module